ncbi:MAG: lipid II:glycine glycyltransferase FemX [Syntrophobacteraceae bacterium]
MGLKFEPSCGYERFHHEVFKGETASAWVSREGEDSCWDNFLQRHPLGQFQQSTIWARLKELDGWKPVRVVLTLSDQIVGGFQILRRFRWWGGIGYITRGPVAPVQHPELVNFTAELVCRICQTERLLALVVQPPDCCPSMASSLSRKGFVPGSPVSVYRATLIFDLRAGFAPIELGMARQTRRKIRQAVNRGVSIREGGRKDLELFFNLMLSTCRRQRVEPNPPDVGHLFALWDAARPLGCIRLFLAEYEGKPLSGITCIPFGKTFTLWKRGWNGMEAERHPNDLLTSEVLKIAAQEGYDICDYSEFDEQMARAIQTGEPLTARQSRSRYGFIAHFGGMPRFLAPAHLYLPNPCLRSTTMTLCRWITILRAGLRRWKQVCSSA